MMFKKPATLVLLPDERSWKERQRLDFRKRDRRGYKRPDAGRKRDRRGYKRPDAGKRLKTHSGATGSSRYRKSGGNKQSTGRATHNQRMKREGAFIVKEEQEEEKKGDEEKQEQFTCASASSASVGAVRRGWSPC